MNNAKRAVFSFEDYKIIEFSLKERVSQDDSLSVQFAPFGEYYLGTGMFKLILNFKAIAEETPNEDVITTKLEAVFRFTESVPESLEEIPGYFYKNAIAIVFPYLRAFISTLTFQANVKPLIMPVLNLISLEQPFKENTKIIQTDSGEDEQT